MKEFNFNGIDLLEYYPKVYDRIARTYDVSRFGKRAGNYDFFETVTLMFELCNELQLDLPSLKVLDVGCGTGKISLPLALSGADVMGLDASAEMLKQFRKKVINENLERGARFVNSSADTIPFATGTFDMVVSSRFLHLFPLTYYPALVCEMLRVVKPGGYVIIELKNKYYGVVINILKNIIRAHKKTQTSSLMSLAEVYQFQNYLKGAHIVSIKSCRLPKAYLLPRDSHLSSLVRGWSRKLLRSISGFLFIAIQKDTYAVSETK